MLLHLQEFELIEHRETGDCLKGAPLLPTTKVFLSSFLYQIALVLSKVLIKGITDLGHKVKLDKTHLFSGPSWIDPGPIIEFPVNVITRL
jgi:hypothetical protein